MKNNEHDIETNVFSTNKKKIYNIQRDLYNRVMCITHTRNRTKNKYSMENKNDINRHMY